MHFATALTAFDGLWQEAVTKQDKGYSRDVRRRSPVALFTYETESYLGNAYSPPIRCSGFAAGDMPGSGDRLHGPECANECRRAILLPHDVEPMWADDNMPASHGCCQKTPVYFRPHCRALYGPHPDRSDEKRRRSSGNLLSHPELSWRL
jgi:hypothetical protein